MGLRRICTWILILLSAFAFNLSAQWTSGGSFGTAQSKSTGTTLTMNPSTNVPSGSFIVICVGYDNIQTGADGSLDDATCSIDGGIGLVADFASRRTNSNGAAAAGATSQIYATTLKTGLTTSQTITITFEASIDAKAMTCWYFTKTSHGATFSNLANNSLSNDAADPGSITRGSLANIEHICVRAVALESDAGTMTATAGFSLMTEIGTSGGAAASNMSICAEFRIQTTTTFTSNPSWTSADNVSSMNVFDETAFVGYSKGVPINF